MKAYFLIIFSFISLGSVIAQEKVKDTLFFKYDNSYIYEEQSAPMKFLLKEKNSDEELYFKGIEILNNLKPKKVLCLKEFIHQPQFYNRDKPQKLKNYELVNFFSDNIVYLVRKLDNKTQYIKVNPIVIIYD